MNRREFLRAAILTAIGIATPLPNNPFATLPTASKAARRCVVFKVSSVFLNDKLGFASVLENVKRKSNFNIDTANLLAMQISMVQDDFTKDLFTVRLFIG